MQERKSQYVPIVVGIIASSVVAAVIWLSGRGASLGVMAAGLIGAAVIVWLVHSWFPKTEPYRSIAASCAGIATLIIFVLVLVPRFVAHPSVEIASPRPGSVAECEIVGSVGRVEVRGTTRGVRTRENVLLWVQPMTPKGYGWVLQHPRSVLEFSPDEEFVGVVQIGNPSYPPTEADVISLAITVVTPEMARSLWQLAEKNPGIGQELPAAKATAIARDIKLQIVK